MRVFSIGVALSLVLSLLAAGADKAGRLSGTVVNFNKVNSEITIRQGSEGTATRMVEYTAATQFTLGDSGNAAKVAPSSSDQVALGIYLTCVGSWDGVKLAASKCTVRPSKRP